MRPIHPKMDSRALCWMHLLPSPVQLDIKRSPAWFASEIETLSSEIRAPRALVNWGSIHADSLDNPIYQAAVLVNPTDIQPQELRNRGFLHLSRYAVVPGLKDPRWFITLDSCRVSAASYKMYSPLKPAAIAKKHIAKSMARMGIPGWYRDQVWVAQRDKGPMHSLIGDGIGLEDPILSISTGTPGGLRKPTVGVFDVSGSLRAIAKISRNMPPQALIQNEAKILRRLASVPDLTARIPKLLLEKEVGEDLVILQSVLPGRRPIAGITEAHKDFLNGLSSGVAVPASQLEPFVSLPTEINSTTGQLHDHLVRVWNSVNEVFADLILTATIVHGDFAPWNLRIKQGLISAFDWEYGYEIGLPLLDEIHHVIQTGYLIHGWTVREANEALAVLEHQHSMVISHRVFVAIQSVSIAFLLLKQFWSGEGNTEFLMDLLGSSLHRLESVHA